MSERGISLRNGKWLATKKVNSKAHYRCFSESKYGPERARQLAAEAYQEMHLRLLGLERACARCGLQFSWIGRGAVAKFCSNACRQRNFYYAHKDAFGKTYKSRYFKPVRPQYERPEIPYEFDTEIQYLTRQRLILSFDESFNGNRQLHERVPDHSLTPLEALLLKEEMCALK